MKQKIHETLWPWPYIKQTMFSYNLFFDRNNSFGTCDFSDFSSIFRKHSYDPVIP